MKQGEYMRCMSRRVQVGVKWGMDRSVSPVQCHKNCHPCAFAFRLTQQGQYMRDMGEYIEEHGEYMKQGKYMMCMPKRVQVGGISGGLTGACP